MGCCRGHRLHSRPHRRCSHRVFRVGTADEGVEKGDSLNHPQLSFAVGQVPNLLSGPLTLRFHQSRRPNCISSLLPASVINRRREQRPSRRNHPASDHRMQHHVRRPHLPQTVP